RSWPRNSTNPKKKQGPSHQSSRKWLGPGGSQVDTTSANSRSQVDDRFPFTTTAEVAELLSELSELAEAWKEADRVKRTCREKMFRVEDRIILAILRHLVGNKVKLCGMSAETKHLGVGTLTKVKRTRVCVDFPNGEKWDFRASDII